MAIRLFAMTCGWLTGPLSNFLEGESGRIRVPVPSFLIEHPDGRVLFDSGMHPEVQTNPAGRYGGVANFFDIEYRAGEEISARLRALGTDPVDIRYLVNSHLHFDHTGGNALLPNARVVVQRREWEAGERDEEIRRNFFFPADYRTGQEVLRVDGEHDLFGDGRVTCIPTHGHTPGHQSLRVRLDGGTVVLTADACYLRRTLDELRLPEVVADREAMLASLQRLRALRAAGARLFYGHDPDFWATVPQAPLEIA